MSRFIGLGSELEKPEFIIPSYARNQNPSNVGLNRG